MNTANLNARLMTGAVALLSCLLVPTWEHGLGYTCMQAQACAASYCSYGTSDTGTSTFLMPEKRIWQYHV